MVSVTAKITYLTPDKGGRLTPAKSGYCPSIRFEDIYVMGAIETLESDSIALGRELLVRIHFPEPGSIGRFLKPNRTFEIAEGPKQVGQGTILALVPQNELDDSR